jgi:insulysin
MAVHRLMFRRAPLCLRGMDSPLTIFCSSQLTTTRLYADLVNDSLTEYTYDADLAGLSYKFATHTLGVWVTLSGYNDRLAVLAHHVLERAKTLVVDPVRLEVMKEQVSAVAVLTCARADGHAGQVRQEWNNFFLAQPYRISDYYAKYLLSYEDWTLEQKLGELMSMFPLAFLRPAD